MVPVCDQLRERGHSSLRRRFGKLADYISRLVCERLGTLLNALEPAMPLDYTADLFKRHVFIVSALEYGRHQFALVIARPFQSIDERQRDLAFSQIAAHRLAEHFLPRGEIKDVIHELERNP